MTTLVTNLSMDLCNEDNIKDFIDKNDYINFITDLSNSLKNRIITLEKYFKLYGEDECNEIINKLSTMYQFSGTRILQMYLYEIAVNSILSIMLKLICIKSLCSLDNKCGYTALNTICKSESVKELPTPCKIGAVCLLMKNKDYKQESLAYFIKIINDCSLECEFRYKTILSLEIKDIENKDFFIKESCITFLNNINNMTLYRILSGQNLLHKNILSDNLKNRVQDILMNFAQDSDLDFNLRADSADVILNLGSSHNIELARKIIIMIGTEHTTSKSIFDNSHNVHVREIENSVSKGLEFLASMPIKKIYDDKFIDFLYVKAKILKLIKESKKSLDNNIYKDKLEKIKVSINRIEMDRVLYGKYNLSISNVLVRVWSYLSYSNFIEEIKKRLLEELYDMSGTCSSGFLSRLVNVISGFGDFNITISWEDQIISNFSGRLNFNAKHITNTSDIDENIKKYCINIEKSDTKDTKLEKLNDFQGKVFEQMSISNIKFSLRKDFLAFFRANMLKIREEMYDEFNKYISDTDYDLYFRKAISHYETGEYV